MLNTVGARARGKHILKNRKKILLSLQACFVIAHSSGDFNPLKSEQSRNRLVGIKVFFSYFSIYMYIYIYNENRCEC